MKVPILMYHRISKSANEQRYTVTPSKFEQQMKFLDTKGYNVISLDSLSDAIDGIVTLPRNSVVITFDDGFQETFDYACPVLKRLRFTATFFLVTKLMGKTNEWMPQHRGIRLPLMRWTDARWLLAEGFEVGSHTATHPVLPEINPAAARQEIEESKRELEDQLGMAIRFFAYPYGRLDRTVQDLVRESGYAAACSTRAGFNGVEVDRFVLRRLDIHGTDSLGNFRRNLIFGENQMSLSRLTGYYGRRVANKFSRFPH